jgi:hypothetical protein
LEVKDQEEDAGYDHSDDNAGSRYLEGRHLPWLLLTSLRKEIVPFNFLSQESVLFIFIIFTFRP